MNKSIIVINSTNRKNGNSEVLVNEFINGAKENNNVEVINLRELNFGFCIGCLACQNTGKCVLNDDISKVIDKVKNADILVFATPIYYYAMSGQLKTFLDRMNPLYIADYKFKEAYLFTRRSNSSSVEDSIRVFICFISFSSSRMCFLALKISSYSVL